MKVLVSFLGTGNYVQCRYAESQAVCYVQTSLALRDEFDAVYICCTPEAEAKNWPGLAKEFASFSLPEPEMVPVPRGSSEDELWDLFNQIGGLIPENCRLAFDITHAFRSLPVLFTVLLQYLRVVKGVELQGVHYGAFEILGKPEVVKLMPLEERRAPLFDLSSFFGLYDWSSAIHAFSEYGVAEPLYQLTKEGLAPILRQTQGANESARGMRCISEALLKHTEYCRSVRSNKLGQLNYQQNIIQPLEQLEEDLLPPMRPVLDALKRQFEDYPDADTLNGVRAARWCQKHGMMQQGITLLQETVISRLALDERLKALPVLKRRKLTSILMNVLGKGLEEKKWENEAAENLELSRVLAADWGRYASSYERLSNIRNDINHGGTLEGACSAQRIKEIFEESLFFFEQAFL